MSDTEYESDYGENTVNSACGRGERGVPVEDEEDQEIEEAVENTIKEIENQPTAEPEEQPAKKLTKKEKVQKEKKQASEKQKLALKRARETRAKKQAEKKAKKELEAEQKKQKAEDDRINKIVEKRLKERLNQHKNTPAPNDEIDGQPVYIQEKQQVEDIEPNYNYYISPQQYALQGRPNGRIPSYALSDPHMSSLFMKYGRR